MDRPQKIRLTPKAKPPDKTNWSDLDKFTLSRTYSSVTWRKLRRSILLNEPLCRLCKQKGIIKQATIIDHIVPYKTTDEFFDYDNLQPLCVQCHNAKSGKEKRKTKQ